LLQPHKYIHQNCHRGRQISYC